MSYVNVTHGVSFDQASSKWVLSISVDTSPGMSEGVSNRPLLVSRFYDGVSLSEPAFVRVLSRKEISSYDVMPSQDSEISTPRKGIYLFRTNQSSASFDSYDQAHRTHIAVKAHLEALLANPSKFPTIRLTVESSLPSREGVSGLFYPGDSAVFSAESGSGDYSFSAASDGATYNSGTGALVDDSSSLVIAELNSRSGKFLVKSASLSPRSIVVTVTDSEASYYSMTVQTKIPETSSTTERISNE